MTQLSIKNITSLYFCFFTKILEIEEKAMIAPPMQHKVDCRLVIVKSPAVTLASKDACTDRWYPSLVAAKQQTINPSKAKIATLLPQNSTLLCLTKVKAMNAQVDNIKTVDTVDTMFPKYKFTLHLS